MNGLSSLTEYASLKTLLQCALPIESELLTGNPEIQISCGVFLRVQPTARVEILGGELLLISMQLLLTFDPSLLAQSILRRFAESKVSAIAIESSYLKDDPHLIELAESYQIALIALPDGQSFPSIERAVNATIANQSAQYSQRIMEIQRMLTRHVAENKNLRGLLQLVVRAMAKSAMVHDENGERLEEVYHYPNRHSQPPTVAEEDANRFRDWIQNNQNSNQSIDQSPLGYTIVLRLERRTVGYLTILNAQQNLTEFDRSILLYSADIFAIEMSKKRAIETAVEQTRGDWVQMWLSNSPSDDDLTVVRARQAGFDVDTSFVVVVFQSESNNVASTHLEGWSKYIRDDFSRRELNGAVGVYVDVLVALYPLPVEASPARMEAMIEEIRNQLAERPSHTWVGAGVSRAIMGVRGLRDGYREARDALRISSELGLRRQVTLYSDLKLYQLLLVMKEKSFEEMTRFHKDTLGALLEHDERKQGELMRTLVGFFDANGNLAKAAVDLDVHRNTLVYRLERIAELTNLDLDDPDSRLVLHLALKIDRVLATLTHR
ncbi:MAG: helix-turn-helix domain-containing protein [Phototrophicaceae bacterium]